MRIISGKHKGRQLTSPKDVLLRPIMDQVKEYLFNVLSDYVVDAEVLDLFAGSGAVGLEALSRSAKKVTFVDIHPLCIASIHANIKMINEGENCVVIKQDVHRYIQNSQQSFDIIFCDPPYQFEQIPKLILNICESKLMKKETLLIIEHFKQIDLAETIADIKRVRRREFGKTIISIYGDSL